MLYSKIKIGHREIKLKPLFIGEDARMADDSKPGTEIIVIKCTENCGEVWVSKSGYSVEQENMREVNSFDMELEKKFTGEYTRNITTRFGEALLILKYSK